MRLPPDDPPHVAVAPLRPLRDLSVPRPADGAPAEVSGASRRLRALSALSGSLTDALTPGDAADLVEQKALSALGATSAVVVTLGAFPPIPVPAARADGAAQPPARPTTLHVVHAIGLPRELKAALDDLPLDAPVPFAEVARQGEPLFLPSEAALRRYSDWGEAMIRAGTGAAAIVPVWANGELRGVLGLAWPDPHTFDEDERAFVLTLGVMCAQAIMRAHLRDAEVRARETAERANRSKAQFVATVSHELRTPMNAVIGYTELLAEEIYGPVSAVQKAHLGRVQSSGKHLLSLVEDLLGYARLEAGEDTPRLTALLVEDAIEESLMLVRPLAAKRGLSIRVAAPVEPIELYTDARKVRQILVNLLANAVKFSDFGEIVLVARTGVREAVPVICLEVTDNGRGIPSTDHERVFEPFWQADPAARVASGSTGLGLSVARSLARLLGGDVTVGQSVVGKGSTFVVWLPTRFDGTASVVQPA